MVDRRVLSGTSGSFLKWITQRFVLAALLCILAMPGHAARWYRVELMIFQQPSTEGTEQWTAAPNLAYPERYRFLIDETLEISATPSGPETTPQSLSGASKTVLGASLDAFVVEVDEIGRTILRVPPPEEEPAEFDTPIDVAEETGLNSDDSDVPRAVAFSLLPSAELEFRGKAAYMERNGGYRILFHESWLQPVADRRQSLPLVLDRSGDGGPWPTLQGSVHLYLTRFLHVETNLWLNIGREFEAGQWRMPAPPRGPASVVDMTSPERNGPDPIIEQPAVESGRQSAVSADVLVMDGTSEEFVPDRAEETMGGVIGGARRGESLVADDLIAENLNTQSMVTENLDDYGLPLYPFNQAVLMQQKRKMRSDEIHYIDHPLFGLVIKFTPIEWDEEAAPSSEDETAAPADQGSDAEDGAEVARP